MVDVFQVLELLVNHVAAHFSAEVDLVAYYGSHARGTATPRSDLDFFYVPAEGKNPPVGRTVLIDGRLFDFWPIRWETLQGFATGRTRGWSMAPALVYQAKVVYKRNDEAAARLDSLKQQIVDLTGPAARPQMIRRSMEMFQAVLARLGNLRLAAGGGQVGDVRHAGFGVLLAAWECLALVNQTLFDQGNRSIVSQSTLLKERPTDFDRLVQTLGTAVDPGEIMAAAEAIAIGTRDVLRRAQESMPTRESVAEMFGGAYPEVKDGFRKVLSACEQERSFEASMAAWQQQIQLSQMLADLQTEVGIHLDFNLYSEFSAAYEALGMPNLVSCAPSDLAHLAAETERLDQRLRQWLGEQGINLEEYADVEAFRRSL